MGRHITITNVKNGREFEYDYEIDREERDRIIQELETPEVLQSVETLEEYGYDLEDLRDSILEDLLTEKRNAVEDLIHYWHNVQNWSQGVVRLS